MLIGQNYGRTTPNQSAIESTANNQAQSSYYGLQRQVATSLESTALPITDQHPDLSTLIQQLQDVQLLFDHPVLQAPHNYHFRRSVEELTAEIAQSLSRLHPELLECIQYQLVHA